MNESDARLLDTFADTLWLEAGLSKNTLSSYRADLSQFSAWLTPRGKTLEQIEPVDIHDYLRDFSRDEWQQLKELLRRMLANGPARAGARR